jgi:hypothetical protein
MSQECGDAMSDLGRRAGKNPKPSDALHLSRTSFINDLYHAYAKAPTLDESEWSLFPSKTSKIYSKSKPRKFA